jgi:hypothetical protein
MSMELEQIGRRNSSGGAGCKFERKLDAVRRLAPFLLLRSVSILTVKAVKTIPKRFAH